MGRRVCISCPEVGAFAESGADDVSTPRDEVEVKVVDYARCIEHAFGGGGDASGLGGDGAVGGREGAAGVEACKDAGERGAEGGLW